MWNEGAHKLTGYSADEAIGQHVSRFYTADETVDGKAEKDLEHARTGGLYEGEGWCRKKNGDRFWANVVLQPYRPAT
jgi:PAS domain S-box-containing protein